MELFGYRLQIGAAANGSKTAVVRVIDSRSATADLDNLNFDPESRAIIDAAISAPDGLIILVGPTGSGKTTTLYACMGRSTRLKTPFRQRRSRLKASTASGSSTNRLNARARTKARRWG
jgi:ABC-type transport system involved in cytochrome bd biosynthesis fused ATPase/permease subunit